MLKRPKSRAFKHSREWQHPRASDGNWLDEEKQRERKAKKEKAWNDDLKRMGLKPKAKGRRPLMVGTALPARSSGCRWPRRCTGAR